MSSEKAVAKFSQTGPQAQAAASLPLDAQTQPDTQLQFGIPVEEGSFEAPAATDIDTAGLPFSPDTVEPQGVSSMTQSAAGTSAKKFIAYTVKLPSEQLSALQSIWLELKRLYGVNSPDKSGMIQQAVADWLKEWDGPERSRLLSELLEIREDTRRRQYRKDR